MNPRIKSIPLRTKNPGACKDEIFYGIYNECKYHDTLEVSSARKYLENNNINHVPVDNIKPNNIMTLWNSNLGYGEPCYFILK
jgi:hypothetical protein